MRILKNQNCLLLILTLILKTTYVASFEFTHETVEPNQSEQQVQARITTIKNDSKYLAFKDSISRNTIKDRDAIINNLVRENLTRTNNDIIDEANKKAIARSKEREIIFKKIRDNNPTNSKLALTTTIENIRRANPKISYHDAVIKAEKDFKQTTNSIAIPSAPEAKLPITKISSDNLGDWEMIPQHEPNIQKKDFTPNKFETGKKTLSFKEKLNKLIKNATEGFKKITDHFTKTHTPDSSPSTVKNSFTKTPTYEKKSDSSPSNDLNKRNKRFKSQANDMSDYDMQHDGFLALNTPKNT